MIPSNLLRTDFDVTGRARVFINGMPLDPEFSSALQSVTVESELNMPAMFTLKLAIMTTAGGGLTGTYQNLNELFFLRFNPGSLITVMTTGATGSGLLMNGVITAIEPEFNENPSVEVRGFDRLYLLRFGTKQRHFQMIRDSDLATLIGAEAGLTTVARPTSTLHPHLIQNNQSSYDFLLERARRLGFELRVEGLNLFFGPPDDKLPPVEIFKFGTDLLEFSASMKVPTKGSLVEVRGRDLRTNSPVRGIAPVQAQPPTDLRKDGFQYAVPPGFPISPWTVGDEPLEDITEAGLIAEAMRDAAMRDFVTGQGQAIGNPNLLPGKNIQLLGLGPRFSGTYYVTAATHTADGEGYRVNFQARRKKI